MSEFRESTLHAKKIEIRQGPSNDLILNLTADDQNKVLELSEVLVYGIPSSWPIYKNNPNHRVDSQENPRFFAKFRDPNKRIGQSVKSEYLQAEKSVMNEFVLSLEIKRLLAGEEATGLLQKYGWGSIKFIEPLVGVIDKNSRKKTMVYDFVEGKAPGFTRESVSGVSDKTLNALDGLAIELYDFFGRNGIDSYDLHGRGFIIPPTSSSENAIYLIDSESFIRQHHI